MPSEKHIEETHCPNCGLAADFEAWRVVDASDAALKEALMDERLFLWTCPHCGHRSRAYYELIYDDSARGFRLLLTGEEGREALLAAARSMAPRRLQRSVADGVDLREKIRILEGELDDRAMEAFKLFLRRYLKSQGVQDKDANAPLLFEGLDATGFLLSRRQGESVTPQRNPNDDDWSGYDEGQPPKLIVASSAIYQDMLEDMQSSSQPFSPEDYPYVDAAWATAYLDGEA